MSEFAFFESTAELTGTGHGSQSDQPGEVLRCVAKVKIVDPYGRSRNEPELAETAADLILMAINPGPNRQIGKFELRRISDLPHPDFGPPTSIHRVGESTITFY